MNTDLPEPESTPSEPTPLPPAAVVPAETPKRPGLIHRLFTAIGSIQLGRILTAPLRLLAKLRPSQPTLMLLFLVIIATTVVLTIRKYCLHHVPTGHMLIVISKSGEPLAEGQILAGPDQKGIREEVLGEGWHIVWPILYETELKPIITVPGKRVRDDGIELPKVGIVKALGGEPLAKGQFLAEKGQQGIQREVLLPGAYRLNPYGYEVKLVDMVEVKPGYVGVIQRKLGEDGPTEFATTPTQKGIIRDRVLQPGLYPINTEEYQVIPCPVGIYQTTYHYDKNPNSNTALVFDASDSNRIQLDCTIEWELKPEFWPQWLAKFRNIERIETAVIMLNVKNISRNKGQDYGAEDFLVGGKREQFQNEFTKELERECQEDNITVRHAFIRNIIIDDAFLKPKRDEQLAKEKAVTQMEQTLTAETANKVVAAEQTITLEVEKVRATTERMVAAIEQEALNINTVTMADLKKLNDEYSASIAILDAERNQLLGIAQADAKKMVETAKSGLQKMQMEVFATDADAYLRYIMSQSLNSNLRLRIYQSGPGTFWTNLGDKSMNLILPTAPGSR